VKILSATQIREWDAYTIAHEPIDSLDLMERAANAFTERFQELYSAGSHIHIFCGPGNNGGDGLAAGRILMKSGYKVVTYVLSSEKASGDNTANLEQLNTEGVEIHRLKNGSDFPSLIEKAVVIDALFGTGLSRTVNGLAADVINHINTSESTIVSIDIPSGLYCDLANSNEDVIIKADRTLTFGCPKLSFFICENANYTGEWEVLDIGLHPEFYQKAETKHHWITSEIASSILKPRERCGHKGDYGHALMIAGSYSKIGAAVLAGEACLRAGAGLLTMNIPRCGYEIMQTALPEAMAFTDENENLITSFPDLKSYKAIGIGPGIGTDKKTTKALHELLKESKTSIVLDADALNILAENKEWLSFLNEHCILTPHPKEFERLAGKFENEWQRLEGAREFARKYNCTLILKGGNTCINLPDGTTWFNTTGNPGMATGGSGDVLTGILTGLLAQGYSMTDVARLGVYLHAKAGDISADKKSQWSMVAGDIIACLGDAFKSLSA
jgi:ADP-dependent NAD(P)H-hydrate dehydratase / NAD(P)H-hydrate epimerase